MKNINWQWILDRLGENSTWRGIIGTFTAAGVFIKPELADKIIGVGIGLVALINIFRKSPPSGQVIADAIKSNDTTFLVKPSTPVIPEPPKTP